MEIVKCMKEFEVVIGSDVLLVILFEVLFMKNEIIRCCMYVNNLLGFIIRLFLVF